MIPTMPLPRLGSLNPSNSRKTMDLYLHVNSGISVNSMMRLVDQGARSGGC